MESNCNSLMFGYKKAKWSPTFQKNKTALKIERLRGTI